MSPILSQLILTTTLVSVVGVKNWVGSKADIERILQIRKLKPKECKGLNHSYQPSSYKHLTYTYKIVKPASCMEIGHNRGNSRKLNSAVEQVVKGLPNKATKEDKRIFYFLYPPWATSGWSVCVVLHQDPLFRVNILIHQLLEYWLPMVQSSGNCLAWSPRLCQGMAYFQWPGMQGYKGPAF